MINELIKDIKAEIADICKTVALALTFALIFCGIYFVALLGYIVLN